MRKWLSLLLAFMMIFSVVNVFAEDTTTEGTTTEETITGGYFTNVAGTMSKTFTETFSGSVPGSYSVTSSGWGEEGYGVQARHDGPSGSARKLNMSMSTANPVSDGNQYIQINDLAAASPATTNIRFMHDFKQAGMSAIATTEQIQYTFYMMTPDMLDDKSAILASHVNGIAYGRAMITLTTEGTINFLGVETDSTYATNTWYKFDVIFNFSNGVAICKINNNLVKEIENQSFTTWSHSSNGTHFRYFGFTFAGSANTQDISLCFDDVTIVISDAPIELKPTGTLNSSGSTKLVEDFGDSYIYHERTNSSYKRGTFQFRMREVGLEDHALTNNEKAFVENGNLFKPESEEYLRFAAYSTGGNLSLYDNAMDISNAGSDILHIQVDMMAEDFASDKKLVINAGWNSESLPYLPINMSKDGMLKIHNMGSGYAKMIPYSTNIWYTFDIVYNFSTGDAIYYIDGQKVLETDVTYEVSTEENRLSYFKFWINKPAAREDSDETVYSYLGIDNLTVELLNNQDTPEIAKKTVTYSIISQNIPDSFTFEEGAVYEASMCVLDTDSTKQTPALVVATYNGDNVLTSISIAPQSDISINSNVKATVNSGDVTLKVFQIDSLDEPNPLIVAKVFETQAS